MCSNKILQILVDVYSLDIFMIFMAFKICMTMRIAVELLINTNISRVQIEDAVVDFFKAMFFQIIINKDSP